jgi:hypothetical protein
MASLFIQRYGKKYGRDWNEGVPRCIMASTFISPQDPSGEKALQHWIGQGQIQDLSVKCLDFLLLDVKDCNDYRLKDFIFEDIEIPSF